jgi:inhibitor of cysteine peptidase
LSCNQTIGTYDENHDLIKTIDIIKYESYPQQINVVARGQLTDSCTKIDDIIETQSGNTLILTITTTRETNQVCKPVNKVFEEVIPLNVAGLRAGIYNVKVNNLSDFFELDVDNFVQ